MEELGNERVRVNLDPVNMISLPNYFHTAELIHECFDLLGENIMGCHAKDTFILPDQQTVLVQEVCPGRGVLDYRAYLTRMSHLAWPRALEPEHIPDEEYPEAKTYLERMASETGVRLYKSNGQ
jgi:sugar phosphate isomerase/epimerase